MTARSALVCSALVAACAAAGPAETTTGAFDIAADPRVGAEIGKACWPGGLSDRTLLGDGFVAFFRPGGSVLVDATGCKGLEDADIDTTIGAETTCLSVGDVLLVGEARTPLGPGTVSNPIQQRCPVRGLYAWSPSG